MTNEESAWFLTTLLNIVRDNSVKTINVKKTPRFEESIEKAIDALTEPKTGEWHEDSKGYFYCDQCHKYPKYQEAKTDFCPSCGADMRSRHGAFGCPMGLNQNDDEDEDWAIARGIASERTRDGEDE